MGDHFALLVNRLLTESSLHDAIESRIRLEHDALALGEAQHVDLTTAEKLLPDDSSPRKLVECRICQDEDLDSNMEMPCSCRGSLKYAHRRCVQRWCDEKGDTTCEICYQLFRPDYTTTPYLVKYRHIPSNIRRNWEINRRALVATPFIRMAPRPQVDDDADSDSDDPPSRSLRCLAVAITFMVLLILRHTLPIIINGPDCCFPLIILVVLRIAGCALLLYIILLGVVGLQQYRHSIGFSDGTTHSRQEQREQPNRQETFHVVQVE